MNIAEVSKLSPVDRFLYWIRERHNIYLRRRAGLPRPWTDDEILQQFYFTNPYREHDKVTVWFREHVRDQLRNDPSVLMATVIFRWFNYIPTGKMLMEPTGDSPEFGLLTHWVKNVAVLRLRRARDAGRKVFTGAYVISSPKGMPKLEGICKRITNVWNDRFRLSSEVESARRLQDAHAVLTRYEGLGKFMAYEIVSDLRYTYYLENALDIREWCNPGPGCVRGLLRIAGENFDASDRGTHPRLRPKDWQQRMINLLHIVEKRLKGMPRFEMREIEHSLCEYDKYERARLGEGHLKRTYNGRI